MTKRLRTTGLNKCCEKSMTETERSNQLGLFRNVFNIKVAMPYQNIIADQYVGDGYLTSLQPS